MHVRVRAKSSTAPDIYTIDECPLARWTPETIPENDALQRQPLQLTEVTHVIRFTPALFYSFRILAKLFGNHTEQSIMNIGSHMFHIWVFKVPHHEN